MTTTLSRERSTQSRVAPTPRTPPGKWRVHRGYAAGAALVITLGALLGALLFASAGDARVEVLVAARDLQVGERLDASDLRVVELSADSDVSAMAAVDVALWEGRVLGASVPADTVLNVGHLLTVGDTFETPGRVEVGLLLAPGRYPGSLSAGQQVDIVSVPARSAGEIVVALEAPVPATVVSVGEQGVNSLGQVVVTVAVDEAVGPLVAQVAALERVTLVVTGRGE